MRNFINVFFLLFTVSIARTQPVVEWQKSLGGTAGDYGSSVIQTACGGYMMAGQSRSNNGDVSGNHGAFDFWIIKTDISGNTLWQKCLGGSADDSPSSVEQTSDGGYIISGTTASADGDVAGIHGVVNDIWIVKIDSAGNMIWQKCLGGTGIDEGACIQQTADGGYIIAASVKSNDGDVSGNHGNYDYWVAKLDSAAGIQWQKCLGGTNSDYANSIKQVAGGGYIVAGYSNSGDGDVSGNHGGYDAWIVKLDSAGNISWKKNYGGSGYDQAADIQQTGGDLGYIIAGYTQSSDGDAPGNHGGNDFWLLKIDSLGKILWKKCFGGTANDAAFSVEQLSGGGYIACGYTYSDNGDVSGNNGSEDYWVIKISDAGNLQWQKCLGGDGNELAAGIRQTADGGFIAAGMSNSANGDVSGNHGDYDYWLVKLSPAVNLNENSNDCSFYICPNPVSDIIGIESGNTGVTANCRVFNASGMQMIDKTFTGKKISIDVSALSNGLYFLKFETENECIVKKFIKG